MNTTATINGHSAKNGSSARQIAPLQFDHVLSSTMHCSLLSLGCIFGFALAQDQDVLPALRAFRIAQRRLRPEVRSKLLGVSSARSDDSLLPSAWRFVFQDPGTSGNCRVVTVAAKASSEHPDTIEAFSSIKTEDAATSNPIVQAKWLVDSDTALQHARAAAKLKGIKAAEYRLSQPKSAKEPLWTVLFYDGVEQPIVRFQVGAKTGVVKILRD